MKALIMVSLVLCEDEFTRRLKLDGCTSMAFGRLAMTHGFPVSSHVNDCADCDNRMARILAKDHSTNSERPVFDGAWLGFPRSSEGGRSPIYSNASNSPASNSLGSIPQVSHTFASWESSYPLINERGLAFGESTTSANPLLASAGKNHEDPSKHAPGVALFAISQLMAIALERCATARCAIKTMGGLAEEHGFYGESFGASEALAIIDKTETWVFEITGDGSAAGALWIAQRVPDDHVAVIANAMIIGDVDFEDTRNFIACKNLRMRTEELGLYNPRTRFNWRKTMSAEKGQPLYAALRMWRIFSQVSESSLPVPKPGELADYPFSVKVSKPLTIEQIFDLHRDHYEGTDYDMTRGVMAGPWGNPNYEFSGLEFREVPGQAPRAISILRTSYCQVATSGKVAKVWFAVDAPATSVFVPFFAEADEFSEVYGSPEIPDLRKFDRKSAFWAFDFVANWMGINYRNMSAEMVYPARDDLQRFVMQEAARAEEAASKDPKNGKGVLGKAQTIIQLHVAKTWWELADDLVVRYNDGYFNFGKYSPVTSAPIPYPAWWLRMIGFGPGFYKPGEHWATAAGPEAFNAAMNGVAVTPAVAPQALWPFLVVFALSPVFFTLGFQRGARAKKSELTEILIL